MIGIEEIFGVFRTTGTAGFEDVTGSHTPGKHWRRRLRTRRNSGQISCVKLPNKTYRRNNSCFDPEKSADREYPAEGRRCKLERTFRQGAGTRGCPCATEPQGSPERGRRGV